MELEENVRSKYAVKEGAHIIIRYAQQTGSLTPDHMKNLETNGVQVIPMISKGSGRVCIDKKKNRAMLHCGTNGAIQMPLDELWEVLNETMDILVHHE